MVVFFNSSDMQYTRRNGLPLRFGSKIDKNAQKSTNYLHKSKKSSTFAQVSENYGKILEKFPKNTERLYGKKRTIQDINRSDASRIAF